MDKVESKNKNFMVNIGFSGAKTPKPEETVNKSKGWINWGKDNDYPFFLIDLFEGSAWHQGILKSKVHYISGNGIDADNEEDLEKLKNLEDFIHAEDEIDPLVKMAIIHYQFEAIHPFFDGNGRTGRIILLLYLKLAGLLDLPALYMSNYIIDNKAAYYNNLRKVTEEGNWEDWIMYMLDMVEETNTSWAWLPQAKHA